MIVKKTFNLIRLWPYINKAMSFAIIWTLFVWICTHYAIIGNFTLNFTPISIIGSALAIFIAFKNQTAYQRWWDARSAWGLLANESRSFARMILTFSKSQQEVHDIDEAVQRDFTKSLIYKQIAYVHALRIHFRRLDTWDELKKFLSDEEYKEIITAKNIPYKINVVMGYEIRRATTSNLLSWWYTSPLEDSLNNFLKVFSMSEKIKSTPLLRQYDIFTRLFVMLFIALLPFGLLDVFGTMDNSSWVMIPLSILISFVFIVLERTGAANEDPFENRTTDVPLNFICNAIERDLREVMGESELPDVPKPVKGYLW
ncbi:bestrophin family protein [Pareuzebyella sediminis]|uniref:bestrophin family protein n=1 Tax=Pareuzebyella sediminis TaxID=2607998 RepID=UPI0011EC8DC9|nr:bestrophin family ion channel [Pareuzebyella sediminis]